MSKIKYQLRVVVYSAEVSQIGKPKKPLFEKYFACPLEDVRFSSTIDVLQQFYSFPVSIEFIFDALRSWVMAKPDVFGLCVNSLDQKLIFDCDGNLVGFISPTDFSKDYHHSRWFPDCSTNLLIQ